MNLKSTRGQIICLFVIIKALARRYEVFHMLIGSDFREMRNMRNIYHELIMVKTLGATAEVVSI